MFALGISLSCASSVRIYKVLSVTVRWKVHIRYIDMVLHVKWNWFTHYAEFSHEIEAC